MSNEAPTQEQADFRAEETGPEQAAKRLAEMTAEPTEGMEEATAEPKKTSEEGDDPTDAPPTGPRPDEVSSQDGGSAPLDLPLDRVPGLDLAAVFIVRPLVCQCYSSVARLAAGIARSFPIEAVEAPILGQAVLRDLAWLSEYLRGPGVAGGAGAGRAAALGVPGPCATCRPGNRSSARPTSLPSKPWTSRSRSDKPVQWNPRGPGPGGSLPTGSVL